MVAIGEDWQAGLRQGKALLIVAVPHAGIGRGLSSFDYGPKRYSAKFAWTDATGKHLSPIPLPMRPHVYSSEIYLAYLLPAGTHGVRDVWGELPERKVTDQFAQKAPRQREIGTVEIGRGSFIELGSTETWIPPMTAVREVQRTDCTAVHRGTGQCVSSWTSSNLERVEVLPGRRSTSYHQEMREGLALHIALRKPMASITLAPGEVVLTDGLVFELPGAIGFGERACRQTAKPTILCELNGLSAQTYPASLENFSRGPMRLSPDVRAQLLAGKPLDRMAVTLEPAAPSPVSAGMQAVLQRAQYRPLRVNLPVAPGLPVMWHGTMHTLALTPATVD